MFLYLFQRPLVAIRSSCVVLSLSIFLLESKWFSKIDPKDSSTDSQDTLILHTLVSCIITSISVKRAGFHRKIVFEMSLGSVVTHSSSREYGFVNSSSLFIKNLYCSFSSSSETLFSDIAGTDWITPTNRGPWIKCTILI